MKLRLILATTFLLLALINFISAAGRRVTERRDGELVLYNGRIITMDQKSTIASALAIRGSRIVAVGSENEARAAVRPGATIIDLRGHTVVPGLIDSHPHLDNAALATRRIDFAGARSISEMLDRIKAETERLPPGTWIVTNPVGEPPFYFNVPEGLAEKRFPNRYDLDKVAPGHPVYITGIGLRELSVPIANSLALKLAGITRDTVAPEGVTIVKDSAGEPTGVFEERVWPPAVQRRLFPMIPEPTVEQRTEVLRRAIEENAAKGLTAIYEGHGLVPDSILAYKRLQERGGLRLRVYGNMAIDPSLPMTEIEKILDTLTPFAEKGLGDGWINVTGIGLSFDASAGTGSALMREPYVGQRGVQWQGVQRIPTDKFQQIVEAAARRRLRVQTQCSGGRAIDEVLKVYDEVNNKYPIVDLRYMVIHSQFPSAENMALMKRLGVVATTSTNFLYVFGKDYLKFYGSEIAHNSIPMKSWLRAGIPVGLSSDRPPTSPLFGIWQAVARLDGRTGETIGAQEKLTREEALRCYTINGAIVAFAEERTGSLEPGKLADLVVLSGDLLTIPEAAIKELSSVLTMVGGRVTHKDRAFQNVRSTVE